jgi:hypothetical protein
MLKLIIVLAAFLTFASPSEARKINWKGVSKETSRIVFFGDHFSLTFGKATQGDADDYSRNMDYQIWRGDRRYLELVSSNLITIGHYWVEDPAFERQADAWRKLKGKSLRWGANATTVNRLGRARYRRFELDSLHCIYIIQRFGLTEDGQPNILLSGYYCQPEVIGPEFPSKLIGLIGYRGEGVPDAPIGTLSTVTVKDKPKSESKSVQTGSRQIVFQVAVNWEGFQELMLGKMYAEQTGEKGTFDIPLQDGSGACRGTWQRTSGGQGGEPYARGTWAVSCENGQAASGTFENTGARKGTGNGTDAKGRNVRITYKE